MERVTEVLASRALEYIHVHTNLANESEVKWINSEQRRERAKDRISTTIGVSIRDLSPYPKT